MAFRSLVATAVAILWLAHVAALAALSGRPASIVSNLIQLLVVVLAAVACWLAGNRASHFTQRIARLLAISCAMWAIGQTGYLYSDFAGRTLSNTSLLDVPYFGFYVPLAMAVFLYPELERRRDWIRTLDFAQVAILLCSIYLYFFVFLASIAENRHQFVGIGFLSVWDLLNVSLVGLYFFRAASSRLALTHSLFHRIGVVLLTYAVGDGLFSYSRSSLGALGGTWWDLAYSLPFGLAAVFAARWQDPAEPPARASHTESSAQLWADVFPLLAPFLVFAMSVHMLARFPLLALSIVGASFSCLALRLVLTQRRQEQGAQRLKAVQEANLSLTRSLELDAVLDTLLEHLGRLIPYDTANVMMLEGDELVVRAVRGYEKFTTHAILGERFSTSQLLLWKQMLQGASMTVPDTRRDSRWVTREKTKFVLNWLAVPIKAGDQVIGFYSLDKAVPNFFTDEHVRLAESLTAQAAVAIQNARLYEQTLRSDRALSATQEKFSKAFYSHPNPMVISTLDGTKLLDVNDSYLRFFGYSREEIVDGKASASHFYDRPETREKLLQRLLADGKIMEQEIQLRVRSGELRTALVSAELIVLGEDRCILGVIHDITARRKAEEALQLSEQRFSKAFHASPIPMAISTIPEFRVAEINASFLRLLGFTREEAIGRTGEELGTLEDLSRRNDLLKALLEGGQVQNAPYLIRARSGESRELLISAEAIDFGGAPHVLVAGVDVTELRRIEDRFHKAFHASPAAMSISTMDEGCYVDVNESYGRMVGYSREELLGRTPNELGITFDSEKRKAMFEQLAREGRVTNLEYVARRRSGQLVYGLISAEIIQLGGKPHVLFVGVDLTEQHHLEERFRKAFVATPVAMAISTLDGGVYVDINEGYTRMTGYSREEVLGRSALKLGLWVNPQKRKEMVMLLQQHGRLQNWEMEIRTKSGEVRNALLSAEILDLDGKPHLLSALLDLTERRLLEEQLRQAQKMEAIGRLAGGVAHDFNNLLMVIIGRCDLALTKLSEKDPSAASVEEALRAAWKAASLTRQLLAFSRKQVLQPQVLNLNTITGNLQKLLERMVGEDVTVVFRPAADLGQVKADPGGMEQILMNLCVNGRDAMPSGGRLIIETANKDLDDSNVMRHGVVPPGRYVMFSVSDTGVGMDSATQARIFEPFFTTKELGKGTGLGLSTVYGIVKQSGGFIWVYSEPGRGASFKVYLPRVDAPVEGSAEEENQAAISRGAETLLIVEDDPQVRELSSEFLRGAGYQVLVSANGRDALQVASTHSGEIRMVVTDVVMPELGGREMVLQLKNSRPRVKVIYLSGYADEAVTSHGELPHGDAFLQKPFRMTDLANKVREVLDS